MLHSRVPTLSVHHVSGPEPDRFPFLDFDGIIAFAHRGGTTTAPENTLASFQNAFDLGYRYLETDVHRLVDGELVAFHDSGLMRSTGDDRQIGELTSAEAAEVRIGGHPIPTMDELFETFPTARFNIDPKTDDAADPLVECIRRHDAIDRVCVGAFSDARIDRVRAQLGPRLCTSPGPRASLSAILPWPVPSDHPVISAPHVMGSLQLGRRVVNRLQSQGYRVHVWTVNEEDEMHRLIDLNVNGIMTDDCELLKSVLEARGLWR